MISRRNFSVAALGTLVAAGALAQRLIRSNDENVYRSTLVNGLTPAAIDWSGRKWRCNMGSTWNPGMDYCLRLTERRARFEIRATPSDHGRGEDDRKRRSELSGSVFGDKTRLPNSLALWGAFSFIHHSWTDPDGMAELDGGVHGQIHMGSKFGGSPALAFRRNKHGEFVITTRGELEPQVISRYRTALSFDQVHHIVYRVVLHESEGSLGVWLDGRKVLDLPRASIGSHFADSFWNIGCYYAGGVSCPVVAEYSNHVYPGATDLGASAATPPEW